MSRMNILVAYPYFTKKVHEELKKIPKEDYSLIVDSGAFSAYNSGKVVHLDEYCGFIDSISDLNFHHVQLDVVFNEEKTIENFKIMRDRGYDCCPVFTRGSDIKYFEKLLADDEYVFVGGVQSGDNYRGFAKRLLEISKGQRVHYLAFVKPDFLNHYKPYSVDSSTWANSIRFGRVNMYAGGGRIKGFLKNDFKKRPPKKFFEYIDRIGLPYTMVEKLKHEGSWINSSNTIVDINSTAAEKTTNKYISVLSYLLYSIEAEKKLGTKIYLALCNSFDVAMFHNAYKHLKRKNLI